MSTKQVIVIRKDLNMRKGKMIAQGAHASMKVFFDRMACHDDDSIVIMPEQLTEEMREWMQGSFTKVTLGVNSEEELINVYKSADAVGLPCSIIEDAGKTEFGGIATLTAVAIGPAKSEDIDAITGKLSLL